MSELHRNTNCSLPGTHETIVFDDKGVCNACRQHELKRHKIDWRTKKQELDELIETYSGKGDYYCLLPSSGGKDSTWTTYCLVKRYGIKPFVVPPEHSYEQIECYAQGVSEFIEN